MPTAAQYGMALPADADMMKNGAAAIRQNADAAAAALTDATFMKGNWPYADANQAVTEGRWNIAASNANAQPNMPPWTLSAGVISARRFGASVVVQEYQEVTGYMRVFARSLNPSNGTVYAPGWRIVRPDASVSNAVGRTVTVWDAVNNREQMIYGDTGLRNITSLLPERLNGSIWLSRFGSTVSVTFTDLLLVSGPALRESPLLPSGFRPRAWSHFSTSPHADRTARGVLFKADGVVRLYDLTDTAQLQGTFAFYTNEPWPAALPGTPA